MVRGAAKREERASGVVPSDEVLLGVEAVLRRQFEQLDGIYTFVEALVRVDALDEIFAVAFDTLERTIRPHRAAVLLFDREGVLRFHAWRGLSEAYRSAAEGHSPWAPDEPTPLPITVEDVRDDPSLARFGDLFARERVLAVAFVPLTCGGRLLGELVLHYDAPHTFDRDELRLAEVVAHHVAFAVARRRSEEELRLYRDGFRSPSEPPSQRAIHHEAVAAELRRALEARQEFLSIASHELKTPITALTLQLDAILRAAQRSDESLSRDWVIERFGGARRQVVRLVQLVDSLLDLSRIDAGRFRVHLDEVDFVEVFRESVERFRDELARAKCPLILHARGSIHGISDAQRIDQVVTNLLSNAVKYGHGAPVEATIQSADGDRVRISVRDEGIGIAESDQRRVFERFERAVSDRRYGGFGLGLFIAREIVQALGGEISVVSAPGRGSLFTVDLPRESPRVASAG